MVKLSVGGLEVAVASAEDAPGMVEVIHAAFGARPHLDPPASADAETAATVAAALGAGSGILARVDDQPAGVMLLAEVRPGVVTFRRVCVHPDFQRHGIASTMVELAQDLAAEMGFDRVELFAREELPDLIEFWQHRGFAVLRSEPHGFILGKALPVAVTVPTSEAMQELGVRLAGVLGRGDLVIASGDLGAGKTTLTQGIGRGLGSTGAIISPTFVLSRVHPSADGRPTLVHVDAYRLSSAAELDDLDLDATLGESVTVVEWGEGLVEDLAESRLEVDIHPAHHPDGSDAGRVVLLRPVGRRWHDVDLGALRSTG